MALAFAGAVYAQEVEQVHRPEGPQLYSASVFGAYYSEGLGRGLGLAGLARYAPDSNSAVGGTASMGWASYKEGSNFALTYSPGFVMSARRPGMALLPARAVAERGEEAFRPLALHHRRQRDAELDGAVSSSRPRSSARSPPRPPRSTIWCRACCETPIRTSNWPRSSPARRSSNLPRAACSSAIGC